MVTGIMYYLQFQHQRHPKLFKPYYLYVCEHCSMRFKSGLRRSLLHLGRSDVPIASWTTYN